MKRVRFYLPPEITIQDKILNVRKKVKLTSELSLRMFRRFSNLHESTIQVYSQISRKIINLDIPLRSQGILPGDILLVLPEHR